MSANTVDERDVVLKIDNADLEQGANQSIDTLHRLNDAMDLSENADSFDKVSESAKKISFNGLIDSLQTVSVKMGALDAVFLGFFTSIGQGLASFANNVKNNIVNAITFPLNSAISLFNKAVNQMKTGGFSRAMNVEQAKFQIEGLGKAWDDVKDSIDQAVSGTAYGADAAAKVASQLLASNVSTGKSMDHALLAISGVAAMTSSTYEDIGAIFTTVAGNGRLMGDQLQQLSSRGLNVAAALGQQLGKTEAEIREMVSKGQIDFQTFADAMEAAFGQHAKDANNTYSGSLSNMKAALSRIGQEVAGPFMQNATKIFNATKDIINTIHDFLYPKGLDGNRSGGIIGTINDTMASITDTILDTMHAFSKGDYITEDIWKSLSDAGLGSADFIQKLTDRAKENGIAVDDLISKYGSFEASLEYGWLSPQLVKDTIASLEELGGATQDQVDLYYELASQVWHGDWGNGQERYDRLTAAAYDYYTVQSIVNSQAYGWEVDLSRITDAEFKAAGATDEQVEALHRLKETAEETGTPLNELLQGLDEAVKPSMLELTFRSFENVFNGVFNAVIRIKDAIIDIFPPPTYDQIYNALSAIEQFTSKIKLSDSAYASIRLFLQDIKKFGDGVWSTLKTLWGFAKPVLDVAVTLLGVVWSIIRGIGKQLAKVGVFLSNSETFKGILLVMQTILQAAADTFINFINIVKTNASNIAKNIQEAINPIVNFVKDTILPVVQPAIKSFFESISNFIQSASEHFNTSVFAGFTDFLKEYTDKAPEATLVTEKLSGAFEFFSGIGDKIKMVLDFIKGQFDKLKNALLVVWEVIKHIGGMIKDFFNKVFVGFSWEAFFDVVEAGSIAGIFIFIRDLVKSLTSMFDGVGGFKETIFGTFEQLKETLSSYQKQLDAARLLDLAKAIGILTIAIIALSFIDPEKLRIGMTGMALLLLALSAYEFAASKAMNAKKDMESMKALSTEFKNLSESFKGIFTSISGGIKGFFSGVTESTKALIESYKKSKLKTMAQSLLLVAAAIYILAQALTVISEVPEDKLWTSVIVLAGMAGAMLLFGLVMNKIVKTSKDNENAAKVLKRIGPTMVMFAASILILTAAVKIFGAMDLNQLIQGGIAAVIAIGAMAGAMYLLGKNPISIGASLAILAMADALFVIAAVAALLGLVPLPILAKGLGAVFVIMVSLSAALNALGDGTQLHKAAAAIMAMAVAITMLVPSMLILGIIPFWNLVKGVGAVSIAMVAMGFAINKMGSVKIKAAAAIMAMGVAILAITPALMAIGKMDIVSIAKGVIAIAGVLAILTGAAFLLDKLDLSVALAAAAGSMLKIGLAALAMSVGLILLVPAIQGVVAILPVLVQLIVTAAAMLLVGLQQLSGLIRDTLVVLGKDLCAAVVLLAPDVTNAIGVLLMAAAAALDQYGGIILDHILAFVDDAAVLLIDYAPLLATRLAEMVWAIGEALKGNTGPMIVALKNLLSGIISLALDLLTEIVRMIPYAGDWLGDQIQGLKGTVDGYLSEGSEEVINNAVDAAEATFEERHPDLEAAGEEAGDTAVSGLDQSEAAVANGNATLGQYIDTLLSNCSTVQEASDTIGGLLSSGLDISSIASSMGYDDPMQLFSDWNITPESVGLTAEEITGTISDSLADPTSYSESGTTDMDAFEQSIEDSTNAVSNTAEEVANEAAVAADTKSLFETSGWNAMQGYINGIRSRTQDVINAATAVAIASHSNFNGSISIESPSKKFFESGMFADLGYIQGLKKYGSKVNDASAEVATSSLEAFRKSFGNANNIIDDGINTTPTITPVMDMAQIQNGFGLIDSMFGNQRAMNMTATTRANTVQDKLGEMKDEFQTMFNSLQQSFDNNADQHYTFESPVYLNGRQIAKASAEYTRSELDRIDRLGLRKRGVV